MNRAISLILFLVLVVGGGLVIGFLTAPGEWYARLNKPAFNPPSWLFGPVWTVLYVMIAIAGWRVWHGHRTGLPMRMWWAQLALNFLWSPVFFGAHQIGMALDRCSANARSDPRLHRYDMADWTAPQRGFSCLTRLGWDLRRC